MLNLVGIFAFAISEAMAELNRVIAALMSVSGQRQTSGTSSAMSAYPSIADIKRTPLGVRQVPIGDIEGVAAAVRC